MPIYTGIWLDFSQTTISRPTLTLSASNAQVLTAFLGALIPVVGVQLWKILAFCTHQLLAPDRREDTLRRQLLVALRNVHGAGNSARTFFHQAWAWKNHSSRAALRCLCWASIAAGYALLLALLATFFPSLISNSGQDIRLLAPSPYCGYWNWTNDDASDQRKLVNDTLSAAFYARDCYGGGAHDLQCRKFAVPQLGRLPGEPADCPFVDRACLPAHPAYFLDSGMLDSIDDFGINLPREESLKFRKTATCAILANDEFTWENENGTGWDFRRAGFEGLDVTFYQFEALSRYGSATYKIESFDLFPDDQSQEGTMAHINPDLQRLDGGVTLIFLAPQGMLFEAEVDDPLFSAHEPVTIARGGPYSRVYKADELGHVVGCVDRFEMCNPARARCTGLTYTGAIRGMRGNSNLDLTPTQHVISSRLLNAALFAPLSSAIRNRGGSALKAILTAVTNVQGPLPDNQWQQELDGWFDTSLAVLQHEVDAFATGPSRDRAQTLIDSDEVMMCNRQVSRGDAGTVNYRLVPLLAVVTLAALILGLSLVLESAVHLMQKLFRKGLECRAQWVADGNFQLLRQVLMATGVDGWQNVENEVPWTRKGAEAQYPLSERPPAVSHTSEMSYMSQQALLGPPTEPQMPPPFPRLER